MRARITASAALWALAWTAGVEVHAQTCPAGLIAQCADAVNMNGVRDDNCLHWQCLPGGTCNSVRIIYADMGGANGACLPDNAVDLNDRFHALNCFANQNTLGMMGYRCEDAPPAAFNVDAGGAFGACCPDGVCDGNDAFHAINAFVGLNSCMCPQNPGMPPQSCPPPTGPEPVVPIHEPEISERTALTLDATAKHVPPGGQVQVAVYLDRPLADLRGYQLHVDVSGGAAGHLELLDVAVAPREDAAFAGLQTWSAFNLLNGQLLVGMDQPGVGTLGDDYLATLTLQASGDAAGDFVVDLRVDQYAADRTFLFPTKPGAKIAIEETTPAIVHVADTGQRKRRGR